MRYESISLPAISVGIFEYPVEDCAKTMVETICAFFESNRTNFLTDVRIVIDDLDAALVFEEHLMFKDSKISTTARKGTDIE
jgi:O-acetyl-ADP-ribose deacetylase (regulator of RNase III)